MVEKRIGERTADNAVYQYYINDLRGIGSMGNNAPFHHIVLNSLECPAILIPRVL